MACPPATLHTVIGNPQLPEEPAVNIRVTGQQSWQGYLEITLSNLCAGRATSGCVLLGMSHLQGWSLHNLPGQPVPLSPSQEKQKGFLLGLGISPHLMLQWHCLYFNLCPLPLIL